MSAPFAYVEPPDVPAGMTLEDYRRGRGRSPRRGLWGRLRSRALGRPGRARADRAARR